MKKEDVRFDNLKDWLSWQESLHFTSIELGLDRCKKVADKLNILNPDFSLVSVAGTNGKGSSVTMLSNILKSAGYKVGTYMSPHLIRYNERIRINGEEIDDQSLCEAFKRIDCAREDISLTFFEFGTLAAIDIFIRQDVDIAVMEVGLGGRLDAVNILDADVALVTSIGLDHQDWLGNSRELIAKEKAGIYRANRPAICSDLNPPETLIEYVKEIDADLYLLNRDYSYEQRSDDWSWKCDQAKYESLPRPCKYSSYQILNASGVMMALHCLPDKFQISETSIKQGLEHFELAGRFQKIEGDVDIFMDVAHNEQAATILSQNLSELKCDGITHIVIGMLSDKDHTAVFRELDKVADNWRIVELDTPRATDTQILIDELSKLGTNKPFKTFSKMTEAIDDVKNQAVAGDRIIITGSFITVGAAITALNRE